MPAEANASRSRYNLYLFWLMRGPGGTSYYNTVINFYFVQGFTLLLNNVLLALQIYLGQAEEDHRSRPEDVSDFLCIPKY